MRRFRLLICCLRFVTIYSLLVIPWPGLDTAIGIYVRGLGSIIFGQSGRQFLNTLKYNQAGKVTTTLHHVVLLRARGPLDKGYSPTTDTIIVLYNYDLPRTSKAAGAIIGLETKLLFWFPFAFYLALVGATPMPWQRRFRALLWGLLTAHVIVIATFAADLAVHASDISMIALSPFWKAAAMRLYLLLAVVSGPSTFAYLFLWPLACFRREELIFAVPTWREWISKRAAADTPTRQQRRAQLRAERKSKRLSIPSANDASGGKQNESTVKPEAGCTAASTTTAGGCGG